MLISPQALLGWVLAGQFVTFADLFRQLEHFGRNPILYADVRTVFMLNRTDKLPPSCSFQHTLNTQFILLLKRIWLRLGGFGIPNWRVFEIFPSSFPSSSGFNRRIYRRIRILGTWWVFCFAILMWQKAPLLLLKSVEM